MEKFEKELAADLAARWAEYREQCQRTLADPLFASAEKSLRLAAGGTVEETDYACDGGFKGAVAVLPRPVGALPRGPVAVRPGDVIVRHDLTVGTVTALKVIGTGEIAFCGSAYDKAEGEWTHGGGSSPSATGEKVPVPEDAPGWVCPAGPIKNWDAPGPNGNSYGRCASGAVVAVHDTRFGFVHVAGFACSVLYDPQIGLVKRRVDRAFAELAWAEISAPRVGPWTLEKGHWVRRSGEVILACVKAGGGRATSYATKLPRNFTGGSVGEAITMIDMVNGWETKFSR